MAQNRAFATLDEFRTEVETGLAVEFYYKGKHYCILGEPEGAKVIYDMDADDSEDFPYTDFDMLVNEYRIGGALLKDVWQELGTYKEGG